MKLKDALGIIFIGVGVTVGTLGYRLLGLAWYFGACILMAIGMSLIWSARRDRKIHEALDGVPGDGGDRRYLSGSYATDGLDSGGDDGD